MSSLFAPHVTSNQPAPPVIANAHGGLLSEETVQQLIENARSQLKMACGDALQRSGNRAQAVSFFGVKARKVTHKIAEQMYQELSNQTTDLNQAIQQVINSIHALYNSYATDFNKPMPSAILFALVEKILPTLIELHEQNATNKNAPSLQNTLSIGS